MPRIQLRVLIDLALAALACLVCYLMGKDLNADMLSYHLYSAHAFWSGTYATTFMGAGSQSYINPIGYLPFYWMIVADWHSYVIAAVLAVAGSVSCMMLWRLGYRWLFNNHPHALALSISGAVLGGLSPLFLATLGTSFLDPLQAALFCVSLYLVAEGIQQNNNRWIAMGGLVLGIATGFKLSMVHLACATTLATLAADGNLRTRVVRMVIASIGLGAGAAISGGYWAWHLLREHGNPVFPFANSLFKSPDFPAVSLGLDRFAAESWTDLLTLPVRMAALKSGVYAEIAVPDIRFAVVGLLLIIWIAMRIRGKRQAEIQSNPASNVLKYIMAVFVLGYVTMVMSSGNGRYFMPLFLIVGPLVIYLVAQILQSPKQLFAAIALLIAAQAIHGGSGNYRRWDSTAWTPRWIDMEVPDELRSRAGHYLFSGSESDTFVAAFLNPGSSYLMIQGKNPLSPNREGADRVRAFMEAGRANLRVIVRESETRNSPLYRASMPDPLTIGLLNDDLAAWSLSVTDQGCRYIGVTLGPPVEPSKQAQANAWPREYSLLSCPVQRGSMAPSSFHQLQAKLERLSDTLATTCPALFPAPPSFPIRIGESWFIRYGGSDVVVSTDGKLVALTRSPFGPFNAPMGEVDTLMTGKFGFECRRLPRR